MKALISDDESPVRESIQLLLDWNKFGITEVFEAENGVQAIEIIQKEHPEIIFTDIRMPLKDGLSLMEWLRENDIDARIIVISGYSDFEYVQHSLRNGAVDYLLKPINPSHLQDAIRRAINQIITQSKLKNDYKKQQMDLNDLLSEIERSYFMKNLEGTAESQYSVYELKSRFPNFMASKPFLLVYLEFSLIHTADNKPFELHWKEMLARICARIRLDTFENMDVLPLYSANNHPYIIVLISNPERKSSDICLNLLSYLEKELSIKCFYEYSVREELSPEIIVSTMKSIKEKIFNRDYHLENFRTRRKSRNNDVHVEFLFDTPMKNAVRNRNLSQVEKLIDLWLDSLIAEKINLRSIRIIHDDMFINIRKWIVETNLVDNAELISFLDLAEGCPCTVLNESLEISSKLLREILLRFFSEITVRLPVYKTSEDELFSEIKDYIQNHCSEELSLGKIAGLFFYSESFISKKFKTVTGISYVEYLTQCRMRKAKTLLRNPDISITEVARAVGYFDEKYFSRVFKNVFKQTPKQAQMKKGEDIDAPKI